MTVTTSNSVRATSVIVIIIIIIIIIMTLDFVKVFNDSHIHGVGKERKERRRLSLLGRAAMSPDV
jgi:hypothetical protein